MSGARPNSGARICAAFVLAVIFAAVALPALHRQTRSADRGAPSPGTAPAVIRNAITQLGEGTAPTERQQNTDPDDDEPRVGAEHVRLLGAEPLLQRLPYRDLEIGVALSGLTGSNKPLLLVTYSGTAAAARADLRAVLARLADPGAEYAWRFQRLIPG